MVPSILGNPHITRIVGLQQGNFHLYEGRLAIYYLETTKAISKQRLRSQRAGKLIRVGAPQVYLAPSDSTGVFSCFESCYVP